MIHLDYRDSRPIYEQVKDGFRQRIIQEIIQKDEKLPSVRELATALTINPNTIQKAYRELEAEGYLYTIAGKGTFAARQEGIHEVRNEELLEEFDEIVEELLFLSVNKENLTKRIEQLAEGGEKR